MPKWTKKKGVITGRMARAQAEAAARSADLKAARRGDRAAQARVRRRAGR